MKITRTPRRDHFTILPNDALEDTRLSYRARGLLGYLLSRPDDWHVDSTQLAARAREGRDAVRAAMRELEQAGYLIRIRSRGDRGRWVTEIQVVDEPVDNHVTGDGFPVAGPTCENTTNLQVAPETDFPASADQASENQALIQELKPRTKSFTPGARRSSAAPQPPTPEASFAAWQTAERCDHGAIKGRCPMCRTWEAL